MTPRPPHRTRRRDDRDDRDDEQLYAHRKRYEHDHDPEDPAEDLRRVPASSEGRASPAPPPGASGAPRGPESRPENRPR